MYNRSSHEKWRRTPGRIVNPDAPVHVVSGAAGDVEKQEGFEPPYASGSAFRTMDYGYNRMLIHNATHLEWLFIATSSDADPGSPHPTDVRGGGGNVVDRMWLIKKRLARPV